MVEMERKHKILIAAGAVILLLLISVPVILIVIWQLGLFSAGTVSGGAAGGGYAGWGSSGFGAVKPIDHTNDGGNLHLVVMNAVGSIVNINVTGVGVTRRDVSLIGGGDTQNVTLAVANFCDPGVDSYDVNLTINYTNLITGLSHTSEGRIWGPCS